MKTQIGTLALLVTIGLAPQASAETPQKLGLTLEPVTNEAEIQQSMMQNRARIMSQYRGLWAQAQAEAGEQTRLGDGDQNQYRNQHRNQYRHQTGVATRDGAGAADPVGDANQKRAEVRHQLRQEMRSVRHAQHDADPLAAKLRYQLRERERTERSSSGDQSRGKRPDHQGSGHGR